MRISNVVLASTCLLSAPEKLLRDPGDLNRDRDGIYSDVCRSVFRQGFRKPGDHTGQAGYPACDPRFDPCDLGQRPVVPGVG